MTISMENSVVGLSTGKRDSLSFDYHPPPPPTTLSKGGVGVGGGERKCKTVRQIKYRK